MGLLLVWVYSLFSRQWTRFVVTAKHGLYSLLTYRPKVTLLILFDVYIYTILRERDVIVPSLDLYIKHEKFIL